MASLGNDLARIRKKRNLTLDDVQEATKIPKHILHSIEDDSIFTDFEENPTYIRSYVRGYAKALSIDDKQIIYALDKREKNDYTGTLHQIAGIESTSETAPEDKGKDAKPEETQEPSGQDSEDDDMIHDHSPAFQFEEEEEPQEDSSQPSAPGSPVQSDDRSEIRSIDWAEKGQQFQPLKPKRSKIGMGVLVVVIAVLGGVFLFYFDFVDNGQTDSTDNTANQEAGTALSTDSLQLSVSPSADADNDTAAAEELVEDTSAGFQNESFDELPDTLSMVVYAAYGRLEPVRVYTDIVDDINPYWIEQGEAVQFNFVNEIRIRGAFNNIVLIMNGHVVQNFLEQFYNPDTRLVEINRSYFENDTQWLQPAPESLGIDVPSPSVINERPTFN